MYLTKKSSNKSVPKIFSFELIPKMKWGVKNFGTSSPRACEARNFQN